MAGAPVGRPGCSIDVIVVTPRGRQLCVLLWRTADPKRRERWELPWRDLGGSDALRDVAHEIARSATGSSPAWLDQVGAFADGKRHPSEAGLSVAYVALVAHDHAGRLSENAEWRSVNELPVLCPRQRGMLEQGLSAVRIRMDHAPVAFRLLPSAFTLGQLQQMYELLLGRWLHKASFRRALRASHLVEPTDQWRVEGPGRPAQLFRYAPRNRKTGRRAVRFDLLG